MLPQRRKHTRLCSNALNPNCRIVHCTCWPGCISSITADEGSRRLADICICTPAVVHTERQHVCKHVQPDICSVAYPRRAVKTITDLPTCSSISNTSAWIAGSSAKCRPYTSAAAQRPFGSAATMGGTLRWLLVLLLLLPPRVMPVPHGHPSRSEGSPS
jgi:hypothetical protein